ncbi:pyrroline-5-carboxylate reductase [Paenibacillus sp. N1-5-1-14]|uniref:pyrroline-5-carboxylate reductase n=1 Tax=Paenibacillus radicibacter TaxID=2972488 RepID=UPI0021598BBF|nr:pyrroline-5-carboxylate reductase [Paenibacillus radicibacter]MCR8642228.1 pyrroline-5-carboxylate reductase [Paenibacillus radicibacter]
MTTHLQDMKITIVGAGSMAQAIIRGLISKSFTSPDKIAVTNNQNYDRLHELQTLYGIHIPTNEADKDSLVREANLVIIAMKPKDAAGSFARIKDLVSTDQLLISVVAGLSISTIETMLNPKIIPIARTMPNTSATIGLGATALSFSEHVSEEQQELAAKLFRAVGMVSIVDESKLDMVTGVSGCGPAYVYYLMESLIKASVEGGLTVEEAQALTIQTVIGAAHMVKETGEEPKDLRRKVTSPGGATEAAIEVLDSHHFSEGMVRAVFRAAERSQEMGDQIAAQCLRTTNSIKM